MAVEVVQLSDPHFLASETEAVLGVPPRESLRYVVDAARREDPDVVLVTGDLSHDGTPASYEALEEELEPMDAPCYGLPGNHDDKPVMTEAMDRPPFRPDTTITAGQWRVLLLDSTESGVDYGQFSEGALDALDADLAAHPERPTLLALHHAPVSVGSAWLDPLNLRSPEGFQKVVESHPQVQLVLFGHVHQAVEACWENAHLYGCPSTCFQFAPNEDTFSLDSAPPGYRTVTLNSDESFQTALHRVSVPFTVDANSTGY